MRADLFPLLAKLAHYPDSDYFAHLEASLAAAPQSEPLSRFAAAVAPESLPQLQDLYTRTFDLNPVCAPELGWHLFGETYERGAFLVRMRQELSRHNITEGSELPDHLAHALELIGQMSSPEAEYFVVACLAPAVHKMLLAIPGDNMFRTLLLAIRESLEHAFPDARDVEVPVTLTVLNEGAMG